MRKLIGLAAAAAFTLGHVVAAQAADVSFSVGQTGDSTMVYRLGLQSNWDASWWQTSVGRLTGYWDGAYTYWDGDETVTRPPATTAFRLRPCSFTSSPVIR